MKARLTIVVEYDLVPQYYPENCTANEMAAIDQENFSDDIGMLIEFIENKIPNIAVIVEAINQEEID